MLYKERLRSGLLALLLGTRFATSSKGITTSSKSCLSRVFAEASDESGVVANPEFG